MAEGPSEAIASVDAVARSIEKTNECLADLTAELGREDSEESRRRLLGHLQGLKGLLAAAEAEAAHLAVQLPRLSGVQCKHDQPA